MYIHRRCLGSMLGLGLLFHMKHIKGLFLSTFDDIFMFRMWFEILLTDIEIPNPEP